MSVFLFRSQLAWHLASSFLLLSLLLSFTFLFSLSVLPPSLVLFLLVLFSLVPFLSVPFSLVLFPFPSSLSDESFLLPSLLESSFLWVCERSERHWRPPVSSGFRGRLEVPVGHWCLGGTMLTPIVSRTCSALKN